MREGWEASGVALPPCLMKASALYPTELLFTTARTAAAFILYQTEGAATKARKVIRSA